MKFFITSTLAIFILTSGQAQKYFTKTGKISFFSDTPIEKIEGTNKSSNLVVDFTSGKLEMATLVKGFQFEKALMQEHFNENYMESNKFPKATFKGQIVDHSKIDIKKEGKVNITVSGDLTLKNTTKKITTPGTLEIKGGQIIATTAFNIKLADYGVSIPNLVKDQIAKELKISVNATLAPLAK